MKKLVFIAIASLLMLTSCTQGGKSLSQQGNDFPPTESQQETMKPETSVETTQPVPLIDCTNLDLLEDVFIKPLGLTRVIGVPWSSPSEIDPDSVLTTYEIKMIGNPVLWQKYIVDYQLLYPAEEVEAYTEAYFGMTAEQTRKYSGYDDNRKLYVVEMGLGGAWDVNAINARQEGDVLHLEYCTVNAYNQTSAYGVMDIRLWADGSYQYLSNKQEDLDIPNPGDDTFSYPAPITETADGTVIIDLGSSGGTKMTYAAAFTAKANQWLEYEVTGDWQGGAVNLFFLSPDKQTAAIRVTENYSDKILLSGGEWNYNCTGSWQSGNVSIIARLKDNQE